MSIVFDNKGFRGAVRNINVKKLNPIKGAETFAKPGIITDIAIKNGQNVLNSPNIIANLSGVDD